MAENIARSLREGASYAVDIATDGEEGLYMAQSEPYDAVLLDLILPRLDGQKLVKQLRHSKQHSSVLVRTSRDEKESGVALLSTGADDYLTKPSDLGELLAR